jgi:Arc/MetJ family transcription regulator
MKSTHNTAWAYTKGTAATLAMVTGTALMIAACSTVKAPPKEFTQDTIDSQVQVPAGNVPVLETTATGLLNYECKANPANQGAIGWVLVTPQADLVDRTGAASGLDQHCAAVVDRRTRHGRWRAAKRHLHPAHQNQRWSGFKQSVRAARRGRQTDAAVPG